MCLSSFAAYYVFLGQYTRYKENPTVLEVELVTHGEFARPGITICPKYAPGYLATNQNEKGIDAETLTEFRLALMNATILNLDIFRKFENLSALNEFDLFKLAIETYPELQMNSITEGIHYTLVMTEAGICYTSSELYENQIDKTDNTMMEMQKKKTSKLPCITGGLCLDFASFKDARAVSYTVFFHSPNEVAIGDSRNINHLPTRNATSETTGDEKDTHHSYTRVLRYEQIKSEANVRDAAVQGRRCLFTDEPRGKFFKVTN